MITIDNVQYDVFTKAESIKRTFGFREGKNAGIALAGNEILDTIGTLYSYTMTIEPNLTKESDYDALYQVLSSPNRIHTVTVPYGSGNGSMTFQCKIQSGSDSYNWKNKVWRHLDVSFVPIAPQRT